MSSDSVQRSRSPVVSLNAIRTGSDRSDLADSPIPVKNGTGSTAVNASQKSEAGPSLANTRVQSTTTPIAVGPSQGDRQDVSVISGMTDPASLDGNQVKNLVGADLRTCVCARVPLDVPSQVILPETGVVATYPLEGEGLGPMDVDPMKPVDASDVSQTAAGSTSDETVPTSHHVAVSTPLKDRSLEPSKLVLDEPPMVDPLVVTTTLPLEDHLSTVSMSAIPDPPSTLQVESTPPPQARSISDDIAVVNSGLVLNDTTHNLNSNSEDMDDYIKSPEVQNAIVERSPGGRYVRFMEKLGSGASKDVYRAYDTQEGIEVAWNVVNLSGVPKSERNRIVNEVRLLERLHHHNIISFHGSWVNRERQEVNFVTEILSSGTLKSFISKVQVIRWKIAKRWALQILNGLDYLHSQNPPVIHRDLKCDNIFINGTSGDLRIGDLGLSTVHRTGRVLSVLGTPEFMAPDMYEEHSYDEKVDIYAFGMCMLEILTQEIPYSECNNPAQIYKRVSSGEPPEVLSRLQSRHAREFVRLCLGRKDEAGKFVRPSASDLIKHPFLVKRNTDDDEVVVLPPLQERVILEAPLEASSSSPEKRQSGHQHQTQLHKPSPSSSNASSSSHNGATTTPAVPQRPLRQHLNSLDDDDGDRFEEMPESETNMRKVKVLMGRGQELREEEEAPTNSPPSPPPAPVPNESQMIPSIQPHYLVAAAVIENDDTNVRPYADDVLKLVVMLPVEGQTQNVQFDFHLVEDDPVQVAKEMVQELGIPLGAVLEISETISALACSARMRQEKYNVQMQESQNLMLRNKTQQGFSQGSQKVPNYARQANAQTASSQNNHHGTHGHLTVHERYQEGNNVVNPDQVTDYGTGINQGFQVSHQNTAYLDPKGTQSGNQPVPGQTQQLPLFTPAHGFAYGQPSHESKHPHQPMPGQIVHNNHQPYQQTFVSNQYTPSTDQNQNHQTNHVNGTVASQPQAQSSQFLVGASHDPQQYLASPPGSVRHSHPALVDRQNSASNLLNSIGSGYTIDQHVQMTRPLDRGSPNIPSADNQTTSKLPDGKQPAPNPPPLHVTAKSVNATGTAPISPSGEPEQFPREKALHATSSSSIDIDDSDDEELSEELRKLDDNYLRNLQRAKKVFHNRMDNLQRSQVEREAQHQKTLEKHEKERAEFEKRLAQEEEQQLRRIEQLQKEWDTRRENLALLKRKQEHSQPHEGTNGLPSLSGSQEMPFATAPPQAKVGHKRNVSSSSFGVSVSPAQPMDHKVAGPNLNER